MAHHLSHREMKTISGFVWHAHLKHSDLSYYSKSESQFDADSTINQLRQQICFARGAVRAIFSCYLLMFHAAHQKSRIKHVSNDSSLLLATSIISDLLPQLNVLIWWPIQRDYY